MHKTFIDCKTGKVTQVPLTDDDRAYQKETKFTEDTREAGIQALARKKLEEEYDALPEAEKRKLLTEK